MLLGHHSLGCEMLSLALLNLAFTIYYLTSLLSTLMILTVNPLGVRFSSLFTPSNAITKSSMAT